MREIILEIVVDSKRGPHRHGSFAARVPRHAYARLQERFGVVFHERGAANYRIGLEDSSRVKEITGSAVVHFIPAVGHFIP